MEEKLRYPESKGEDLGDDSRTNEWRARKHLVALGQPECRELCEAMYNKLPREVRDMVYSYLVCAPQDARSVGVAQYYAACNTDKRSRAFYPWPHRCAHGFCTSHILDTAYVGALVQ
jgi:hypothetical protein